MTSHKLRTSCTYSGGMVGEDNGTSREGKRNLLRENQLLFLLANGLIWAFCWQKEKNEFVIFGFDD